nr:learning induced brain peptide [Carassius auratus]
KGQIAVFPLKYGS